MSIERVRRSNQSNAIERDRTVEIRLSNAIESQSNGQILGNYSIGSIEIQLRSIEILRSIAFDLGSIMFDWDLIALRLIEIRLRLISEPVQGREKESAMGGNFIPRKLFRVCKARARCVSAISCA